jgi:hypothetical protein
MIAVQGEDALDWTYLADWAGRLGITTELDRVRPTR